ncbi:MAG: hypothetical protein ACK5PP_06430 [Acidimicrobiales bacterium]
MTGERREGEPAPVVELGEARRRRPRRGPAETGPTGDAGDRSHRRGPGVPDLEELGLDRLGDEFDHADDPQVLLDRLGSDLPAPATWFRALIAVLAMAQLAVVAPWLVTRDPFGLLDGSTGAHLTRDGALGLAVAAAALLAAWRPRWAVPAFVLAAVALVAQTVAGLVEPELHRSASVEFVHLPSVLLTVLVGLSAVRLPALGPTRPRSDRSP